jgi:uncharacterized protein YyaL (SSP411 family)
MPDSHEINPGRLVSSFIEKELRSGKKPNRLLGEKSPYLLQHAFNPVDWYPWGEEAFEKAKREDRVIFLSIGYSTCYWCHVMEREVFERPEIAVLMNELAVNIKVDREERPDIDRVYMASVQAMTGGGGWPMSVFLTPDLKPFYGATYIPPVAAHGRPGFPELLTRIAGLWKSDRDRVADSGEKMIGFLRELEAGGARTPRPGGPPVPGATPETSPAELAARAAETFSSAFDAIHGGFGGAPKFPRPVVLAFLFAHHHRTGDESSRAMALETLRAMAAGGMYDHLAGGFHRYSVDGQWRVPHFEKMLYDQAQLAVAYIEAFQLSGDPFFAVVAREVLAYVLGEMRDAGGGFYSAEDAESVIPGDTVKEEGAFYVWTMKEILDALGEERGRVFAFRLGASDSGNALHDPMGVFGGKNILYAARTPGDTAKAFGLPADRVARMLDESRAILRGLRSGRPRPHLDDKIISGWNGLMISAFSKGYQAFGDPAYLEAASGAAAFVLGTMVDRSTGRLFRRYRDGEARFEGGLQDYAFVVQGLIDLYESNFDESLLSRAVEFARTQSSLFRDPADGGYYDTSESDPTILLRLREDYDGAEPSGNAVTALNLFRLARLTDDASWREAAEGIVLSVAARIAQRPESAPLLLAASFWGAADPMEIIVSGSPGDERTLALLREIRKRYLPFKVVIHAGETARDDSPLPKFLRSPEFKSDAPSAYVCRNYACRLPTGDPALLGPLLDEPGDRS